MQASCRGAYGNRGSAAHEVHSRKIAAKPELRGEEEE